MTDATGRPAALPACVVFDAYRTLLEVHAAVQRHAARLGPQAAQVSAMWRARQLEYSWILSATGDHEDFAAITGRARAVALAAHGIADAMLQEDLLAACRRLDAFPDAAPTLAALRRAGMATAILSNGEPAMLAEAVAAALSVHPLRRYKPAGEVSAPAHRHFACQPHRIASVSGNGWDAFGAARSGLGVFWLTRAPGAAEYGLERLAVGRLGSLAELPARLAA